MIQRIQSIYLFLSFVALALMFIFPVSTYYGDLHTLELNLLELVSLVPGTEPIFQSYFTYPLVAFTLIIALLSLVTIFKYSNRKAQLKNIKISILLNILLIIAIFLVYSKLIVNQINAYEEYGISAFLPLLSLVFFVLAYRGVKKDEELIRSADRLR